MHVADRLHILQTHAETGEVVASLLGRDEPSAVHVAHHVRLQLGLLVPLHVVAISLSAHRDVLEDSLDVLWHGITF